MAREQDAALDAARRPGDDVPAPGLADRAARVLLAAAYRALRVYWRLARPHTAGAYAVVWSGERLLLVLHSYKAGYSVPAGHIGRGETPAAAAARELREETGVAVDPGSLRLAAAFVSEHEARRDHVQFFEVELPEEPALRVDRREVVWAGFRSPAEARRLPLWPPLARFLDERGLG